MGALAWKLPEPAEAERRHDQRVEVSLLGRFILNSAVWAFSGG
jgi:hypothetical protein